MQALHLISKRGSALSYLLITHSVVGRQKVIVPCCHHTILYHPCNAGLIPYSLREKKVYYTAGRHVLLENLFVASKNFKSFRYISYACVWT